MTPWIFLAVGFICGLAVGLVGAILLRGVDDGARGRRMPANWNDPAPVHRRPIPPPPPPLRVMR